MPTQHRIVHSPKASQPQSLPVRLYDLRAASEMFSRVVVLPEQYYDRPAYPHTAQGAVALMRAVLEDALHCFEKQFTTPGRHTQRLAEEAEEWLFKDDPRWLFSFVNICEVLGLDPAAIRQGLAGWAQHPPAMPRKKRPRLVQTRRPLSAAA